MQDQPTDATPPLEPKVSKPARARRKPALPAADTPPARKVARFKLSRSTALLKPVADNPAPVATATMDGANTAEKTEKPKKPKLVRDSFTIPKNEYAALTQLKDRAAGLNQPAKKSELLRAGLMALLAMTDDTLRHALAQVPSIKTGRPRNSER